MIEICKKMKMYGNWLIEVQSRQFFFPYAGHP